MAKEQTISKTEAVREYFKAHPEATRNEVVAALMEQGLVITPNHVGNIKAKLKKTGKTRKTRRRKATAEAAPAAVVVETPAKANGTITLEQIQKVARAIKTMGGFQHMTDTLEVIRELGGLKKFKDVAEAMSALDTYDDIPF
jgi:hypothetical protein